MSLSLTESLTSEALLERFSNALTDLPLIAILRGMHSEEACQISKGLYELGFRLIEVPLNSPDPYASILAIRRVLPSAALVGAGTVLNVRDVMQIKACGGEFAVMPHADCGVIRVAKSVGLLCIPGVVTPTEVFSALSAGADALKLFPAELISPQSLKAMRAVIPKNTRLLPVGGITDGNMKSYLEAGADGFGLGGALYLPGMTCEQVMARGRNLVATWKELTKGEQGNKHFVK